LRLTSSPWLVEPQAGVLQEISAADSGGDANGKGKGALRRVFFATLAVLCAVVVIGISTKEEGESWDEWGAHLSSSAQAASAASMAVHISSYVSPASMPQPSTVPSSLAESPSDCPSCVKRAQMHQARLQAAGDASLSAGPSLGRS